VKQRPAFTLVDFLVALAVLAVVMTAVYAVFAAQDRALRGASEAREVYTQGTLILDRLTRDLTGAWLPGQPRLGPGLVYRFQGTTDRLDFITTASLSQDQLSGPDLVEAGYRTAVKEGDRPNVYRLIRRQDDTPDDQPDEGGREIILTQDLIALELTYGDPTGQMSETWEASSSSELPRSVQVKIVLADSEGREEIFIVRATLPLTDPAVQPINMPQGVESLK